MAIDARDKLRTITRGKGGRLLAAPAHADVSRARHAGTPAPTPAADLNLTPGTAPDGGQLGASDNMPLVAHQVAPMPADPLRRTVWASGSRARWILRLRQLFRWIAARLPFRPPTAQQRREKSEMAARRLLERQLREEAGLYRQRVTNALDRLGMCYRFRKSEKDWFVGGKRSVRFDVIRLQPEALSFHVDTARLPRGVNIMQLMQPDVLTDLTLSCGVRVTAEYSEKIGAWYILERATGARGVPAHVPYADMLERFPEQADGLAIAFGLQSNNRVVYRSLSEMPHMLVAGTTGAGKSNFLNSVLCSWISRNHPDALKIIAVDLKGGMEFNPYRDVPHIMQVPGLQKIINDREQVEAALEWLFAEVERRIKLIEGAGKNNIAKYNQKHKSHPLPRIVLLIDEYADLALFAKLKARVEPLLTNICQRSRAVGIHVLLCTQRPEVAVVSGNIKGVLPAKVAFNCTNNASSMVILDNSSAKGLGTVGRCILQLNGVDLEVQTPYMPDDLVADVIKAAIANQGLKLAELRKHDVTPDEIMRWALTTAQGEMSVNLVYQTFRGRGLGKEEVLNWLKSWDGQQFVVNGSLFRVEPGAGTRPRRLVAEMSRPGSAELATNDDAAGGIA